MFVSSEFESVSDAAFAVYSDFFDKVAGYLGANVTSNFSIPAYWNETSDAGVPLTTLLNTVRWDLPPLCSVAIAFDTKS